MVRKQLYLKERHNVLLKRLARARGVSEAEVVRQAIEETHGLRPLGIAPDPAAWDQALTFMQTLAKRARRVPHRRWSRRDAYIDRLTRYGRTR